MDKRIRPLKELNIIDDYLFAELMKDMEAARIILEKILGKQIEKVEQWKAQEEIKTMPEYHGIRLDVYIKDGKGTVYNVEVQVSRKYDIPKRMRYYQSLIDYTHMARGEHNYNILPTTYIIFMCDYDVFDEGMYQYIFKNRCQERPELLLGDEATKIILNTKGKNDGEVRQELVRFLKYVSKTTKSGAVSTGDEDIKYLQQKVEEIKSSEKKELRYMTYAEKMWEMKNEGREEGKIMGIIEAMLKLKCDVSAIEKMLKEDYGIEETEAKKLIEEIQGHLNKAS